MRPFRSQELPSPCPGPHELASEVVEAGQPAPESIMSLLGGGRPGMRCAWIFLMSSRLVWSDERKAAARRRNL